MSLRVHLLHCPACAAPLDVRPGAARIQCEYCRVSLVVEASRVSESGARSAVERPAEDEPTYEPPSASLFTQDAPRFELSAIIQRIPKGTPDVFEHVELPGERFALVYLRAIDAEGRGTALDLAPTFAALRASLEEDGDPGLAANRALENACAGAAAHKLECAILAFEPKHMTMTPYNAGCGDALWWVSQEEGRTIQVGRAHSPLERKLLRQQGDHFTNGQRIHLAAGDLFLLVSAGYAARGSRGYFNGGHELLETLNAHIGEEPLRVVTLVKNAWWEARAKSTDKSAAPVGDVTVAAVRAVPPELRTALSQRLEPALFQSRRMEIAILRGPRDVARLEPLHGDRQVLVWLSPRSGELSAKEVDAARAAILAVLDRPDHGDNENPRLAGRQALAALGARAADTRVAVIQLLDAYQRVKYFRAGWKQAVSLGPRGFRDADGIQQYDGGGDTGAKDGSRVFFPGALAYEGDANSGEQLAAAWTGGKASRLYEALFDHWKTKRLDKALIKLALAAESDGAEDVSGLALVGAREP